MKTVGSTPPSKSSDPRIQQALQAQRVRFREMRERSAKAIRERVTSEAAAEHARPRARFATRGSQFIALAAGLALIVGGAFLFDDGIPARGPGSAGVEPHGVQSIGRTGAGEIRLTLRSRSMPERTLMVVPGSTVVVSSGTRIGSGNGGLRIEQPLRIQSGA